MRHDLVVRRAQTPDLLLAGADIPRSRPWALGGWVTEGSRADGFEARGI
jgi:hypothetical protein